MPQIFTTHCPASYEVTHFCQPCQPLTLILSYRASADFLTPTCFSLDMLLAFQLSIKDYYQTFNNIANFLTIQVF